MANLGDVLVKRLQVKYNLKVEVSEPVKYSGNVNTEIELKPLILQPVVAKLGFPFPLLRLPSTSKFFCLKNWFYKAFYSLNDFPKVTITGQFNTYIISYKDINLLQNLDYQLNITL